MRKANRAVTDKLEQIEILKRCDVCRIGFYDGDYPYIVPMNFGFIFDEGLVLYFHCATEGRKLDMIKKNNKVGFSLDCSHKLITGELACDYSMNYESIIGEGEIFIVDNYDEKITGLNAIMAHYGRCDNLNYNQDILSRTVVLALVVRDVCGKRLNK